MHPYGMFEADEYLVQWEGHHAPTWEPEQHLNQTALDSYKPLTSPEDFITAAVVIQYNVQLSSEASH